MKSSFEVSWIADQPSAQKLAGEFDLIITGNPAAIAWLKAANPNITVLCYIPYAIIYSNLPEYQQAIAGGWLLKDAAGNYVNSLIWPTAYYCNPNNPGYQAYWQNYIANAIAQGYDGVFLDGGTSLQLQTTDVQKISGNPINPATGQIWTHAELTSARANLNRLAKTAAGNKLSIGNGLMSSDDFNLYPYAKDDYQTLLDSVDGAMIEYIICSPWAGQFPGEAHWLADVALINWHTSQKITMLWSGTNLGTAQSSSMYIYASYLIGTANMDNMINCIQSETTFAEDPFVLSLYKLDIGVPLAPYSKVGNHYERLFTKTSVYLNPTDSVDTAVLDATYIDLISGQTITSLTIQPHTGYVLKRVTPLPPPSAPVYVVDIWTLNGGSTNPTGPQNISSGTNITITATPDPGYTFVGWLVNNQPVSANPLTLTITGPTTVIPQFQTVPTFTLTIIPSTGGKTDPAAGAVSVKAGTDTIVKATADQGYVFDHWLFDGQDQTAWFPTSTFTLWNAQANHTLQAVFTVGQQTPPTMAGSSTAFLLVLGGLTVGGLVIGLTRGKKRTQRRRK